MKTRLSAILAGALVLGGTTLANADQLVTLTGDQLDKVIAGSEIPGTYGTSFGTSRAMDASGQSGLTDASGGLNEGDFLAPRQGSNAIQNMTFGAAAGQGPGANGQGITHVPQ